MNRQEKKDPRSERYASQLSEGMGMQRVHEGSIKQEPAPKEHDVYLLLRPLLSPYHPLRWVT
jgi:hypothetical protein